MLKKTSKTGYLARLAKDHARRELLSYAAEEYLGGKVSLSELAKKTSFDVPANVGSLRLLAREASKAEAKVEAELKPNLNPALGATKHMKAI
jgi:hypothetical protein